MMTTYFPIIFEQEASGAVSAFVPGLPVYAQAATTAGASRAIRATLAAYLEAHPAATTTAVVRVARHRGRALDVVSAAALVGRTPSAAKARAARANGRLGGRPRLDKAAQ